MNSVFLFDVDGTLTPPRGKMDPEFQNFFCMFQEKHPTYLVTGSDFAKTVEQVGLEVIGRAKLTFQCAGNEVRKKGVVIQRQEFVAPHDLQTTLLNLQEYIGFPGKKPFIERRTGAWAFYPGGANATKEERDAFAAFDEKNKVREKAVTYLSATFNQLDFQIGGQVSIDIYHKGRDKSQITSWFEPDDYLYFFGDKIENGNDKTLAAKCFMSWNVRDWRETRQIMEGIEALTT